MTLWCSILVLGVNTAGGFPARNNGKCDVVVYSGTLLLSRLTL